jgi:hypothetical protein
VVQDRHVAKGLEREIKKKRVLETPARKRHRLGAAGFDQMRRA